MRFARNYYTFLTKLNAYCSDNEKVSSYYTDKDTLDAKDILNIQDTLGTQVVLFSLTVVQHNSKGEQCIRAQNKL